MKLEQTIEKLKEFVKDNKLPLETIIKMVETFENYNDEEMIKVLIDSQGLGDNKEFLKYLTKNWQNQENTLIRGSYSLRKLQFDKVIIEGKVLNQLPIDENFFDFNSMRVENLLSLVNLWKKEYNQADLEYLDLKRQVMNELSKDELNDLMSKIDKLDGLNVSRKAFLDGLVKLDSYLKNRTEEIAKLGYLLG